VCVGGGACARAYTQDIPFKLILEYLFLKTIKDIENLRQKRMVFQEKHNLILIIILDEGTEKL